MLLASVGPVVAQDLGLASGAMADDSASRLTFGAIEPLVALMQDTPIDRLLPAVVDKIKSGEDFGRLVAAAALANARTFGGNDYEGYHTLMALVPAYQMSRELPDSQKALPLLKVFYRNTNHIQQLGGHSHEALHPVAPAQLSAGECGGEALREAVRRRDVRGGRADVCRARPRSRSPTPTTTCSTWFRTTLTCTASSWPGGPGACSTWPARKTPHTLLRQSVRFCCDEEKHAKNDALRVLLPRLLETKGLLSDSPEAARSNRPVDRTT